MSKSPNNTLNIKPISKTYINDTELESNFVLKEIYVKKEINKIGRAEIEIIGDQTKDDQFSEINQKISFGSSVIIKMGYKEENLFTVFEGVVESKSIIYQGHVTGLLKIECVDKAIKLTNSFTNTVYQDKSDFQIIEGLIASAGISLSTNLSANWFKESANLNTFLSKYNNNDWEFILDILSKNGLVLSNTNNGIEIIDPSINSRSKYTISATDSTTYSFYSKEQSENQIKRLKINSVDSYNYTKVNSVSNEPTKKIIQSDNIESNSLNNFSTEETVFNYARDLGKTNTDNISNNKLKFLRLNRIYGQTSIRGCPDLNINDVVTLQKFGSKIDGEVFVSEVKHVYSDGGLVTNISFGLDNSTFKEYRLNKNISINKISGLHLGKVIALTGDPLDQNRVKVVIPELESINEKIFDNLDSSGIWAKLSNTYVSKSQSIAAQEEELAEDESDEAEEEAAEGEASAEDAEDGGEAAAPPEQELLPGFHFLPELDTQVIVSFLGEDPTQPVILGSLYTANSKPSKPLTDQNLYKAIVPNENMQIEFDDESKILTIRTKKGNQITLDESESGSNVTIADEGDKNNIQFSNEGLNITSQVPVTISGPLITLKTPALNLSGEVINISGEEPETPTEINISEASNISGVGELNVAIGGILSVEGEMVNIDGGLINLNGP